MSKHSIRTSPWALTALLALAACASPEADTQAPAETAAETPAIRDTATGDGATTAATEVVADDLDNAVWGVSSHVDAAALRAFLAEGVGLDSDASTVPVSFTDGDEVPASHVVTALRLRNGKLLAGRLVSDDGESVEFAFQTADGVKGTTRVAYTDIHPESVAELMLARADQGDAGALMEIAEYAAAEGLYEVARVHYLAAAERDPAVAAIADTRLRDLAESVSEAELARGSDAVEQGNDATARRILRRVQREFAGTKAAQDAAAAIQQIDDRAAAKRLDAAREKQLTPIRKLLADADELTGKGLSTADKPSTAIRSYMASRSKAASARKRLPAARRAAERAEDTELTGALDDIEAQLDQQVIDNETHLATAYLDKGDFSRARQAANAVLAIDRQNREALALLGQIRAAEEEHREDTYDAWWYRYRRHNGVYPYPRRWYPGRGRRYGAIRRGGASTRAPIGVFRR